MDGSIKQSIFDASPLLQHCNELVSIVRFHSLGWAISNSPFCPANAVLVLNFLTIPEYISEFEATLERIWKGFDNMYIYCSCLFHDLSSKCQQEITFLCWAWIFLVAPGLKEMIWISHHFLHTFSGFLLRITIQQHSVIDIKLVKDSSTWELNVGSITRKHERGANHWSG